MRNYWQRTISSPYLTSAAEVGFTLVLSNAVILLAAFIVMLQQDGDISIWKIFSEQLLKFIKPTEIIVFILAVVSPAIWMMLKSVGGWRHMKFWALLLFIQFIIIGVATIIFAMSLIGVLKNQPLTNMSAVICLIFAILVWYITLVYQKKVIDNLPKSLPRSGPGKASGDEILNALEGK